MVTLQMIGLKGGSSAKGRSFKLAVGLKQNLLNSLVADSTRRLFDRKLIDYRPEFKQDVYSRFACLSSR